jgi:hypothetical protein
VPGTPPLAYGSLREKPPQHPTSLVSTGAVVHFSVPETGALFQFLLTSRRRLGMVPIGKLVYQVMTVEPYRSARTVYWVVDNGSSHCVKASIKRMTAKRITAKYPNAKLIHLPVHA